ncbi:MAG: guanylate kinase [Candidatus Omnitrophica bacterium]|nr:guanylate kinase [Candidatus Omnitrophota bacterium]
MSKIFVISGPSGSGKTTLVKELLRDRLLKKKLVKSISLTTRPRRKKELKGKDYFFVSKKEFISLLKKNRLLEYTKYLGYYYGTSKDFIEKVLQKNKNILLCLDLRGAKAIKKLYPEKTKTIFVAPPSLEVLKERIKERSPEIKENELKARLFLAKREIKKKQDFDCCIVNEDLKESIRRLKKIILKEI